MNTDESSRKCNFCGRNDVTDFSKCRYCGEKYGTAPPPAPKTYLTEKVILVGVGALCIFATIQFLNAKSNELRNETLATVKKEILVSHKPRLLEFYAKWCGPCRMYGPLVEDARSRYPGVDFYRYDVDDSGSSTLTKGLGVRAIPVTCFFDSDGHEIHQQVGTMTQEELDGYLKRMSH